MSVRLARISGIRMRAFSEFTSSWDPLVGAMERSRAIALVARILSILIDWTWDCSSILGARI
jgi:hypothetical protein